MLSSHAFGCSKGAALRLLKSRSTMRRSLGNAARHVGHPRSKTSREILNVPRKQKDQTQAALMGGLVMMTGGLLSLVDSQSNPTGMEAQMIPGSVSMLPQQDQFDASVNNDHGKQGGDSHANIDVDGDGDADETTTVINWSGTHSVEVLNTNYWEPESIAEVEEIVKKCHEQSIPLRPIGSSLSPNGIALNSPGMIAMVGLDQVVEINETDRTITVQAGMTVNDVIEALRPYGLTLPNLASIAEQQMGGFVQVGAHGTGRCVAPVDEYVTKIKLVTPGLGTIELTKEEDGTLFELARVAMGCLGVVVEVTMKCIPAHRLVEHTFVLTRQEARDQLDDLLKNHKHMRYMWIPYTDSVVVVTNDPEDTVPSDVPRQQHAMSYEEASEPLVTLLKRLHTNNKQEIDDESIKGMGFGELRDALLAFAPLDIDHVKLCNEAEAEFWRRSSGYQTQPSDKLLQFDCGGQQWVFEVCFATGTQEKNNGNDMDFMDRLLAGIERQRIPAHSPIEQRWSASSSSPMSPAHGEPSGMHTWVGIINYLPSEDEAQRKDITKVFTEKYSDLVRIIGKPFLSVSHWAKLEQPRSIWHAVDLLLLMQNRYPLEDFNKARGKLDPNNILSNKLIDTALGTPIIPSESGSDDGEDHDIVE